MVASRSERELRRMVLRLKSLTPADFDAVIEDLDEGQRRRTLDLLQQSETSESVAMESSVAAYVDVLVPAGISLWLAARINGKGEIGQETADFFELTRHAQSRLRNCAAAMVPAGDTTRISPSLVDRLWSAWS
jgi:hypothetical protein